MQPGKDHSIIEAAMEGAEVVADALMRGDAFADVPVIGMAFKVARAVDRVRDNALAAKLTLFVNGAGNISAGRAEAMRKKLSDPAEARRIGEALVLTLDRITEIEKAEMLGRLFGALVDGVVTSEELRRLMRAVDVAFFDDLQQLIDLGEDDPKIALNHPLGEQLNSAGLTNVTFIGGGYGGGGGRTSFVTPLGRLLLKVYGRSGTAFAA